MNILNLWLILILSVFQVTDQRFACWRRNANNDDFIAFKKAKYWDLRVKNLILGYEVIFAVGDTNREFNIDGKNMNSLFNNNRVYQFEVEQRKIGNNFKRGESIFMLFCRDYYRERWYLPDQSPTSGGKIRGVTGYVRCSLLRCELGVFYKKENSDPIDVIKNPNNRDVFIAYISNGNKEAEIFFDDDSVLYNKDLQFPYVLCPYFRWIADSNYIKFEVTPANKNNGPIIHHGNHIYVPAYPNHEDYKNVFMCGYIIQNIAPPVRVGFKLQHGNGVAPKNLHFLDNEVKCGDLTSSQYEVYVYTPKNLHFDNNEILMKRITGKKPSEILVYSGDYILFFKTRTLNFNNYEDQVDVYQTNTQTECAGKVGDPYGILQITLDSKHVKHEPLRSTENNTFIVFIDSSQYNKSVTVQCKFKSTDNSKIAHSDFYSKRYEILFYKEELKKADHVKSKPIQNLDLTKKFEGFYGIYSCKLKTNTNNIYVKNSEIVILPKDQVEVKVDINFSFNDLNKASCDKKHQGIGNLKKMIVKKNNEKSYLYGRDNKDFKVDLKLVIFISFDKNDVKGATIECEYEIQDIAYIKITKTLQLSNEESKNDNFLIILSSIIGVIVVLVLIIITAVVVISMRKRKKSNLLSKASSATSASSSSVSKSKLMSRSLDSKRGSHTGSSKIGSRRTSSKVGSSASKRKSSLPKVSSRSRTGPSKVVKTKLTSDVNSSKNSKSTL